MQNNGIKKRYICLFDDNSQAAKDPVPQCALLWKRVYACSENVLVINVRAMKRTQTVVISNVQ